MSDLANGDVAASSPARAAPRARRAPRLMLLAIALAAIATLSLATRWGLALSSDSARYVRTARSILGTEPIVDTGEPKREQSHYPPFYSMTLAAAGAVTRSDPLRAARWLHVALFGANVFLAGAIVLRLGGRPWAAALAALATALSPVMIFVHAWLLSEALFILLSLITILLLARHLERPYRWLLIGAALAGSLGMMTRYAGAATAPAALLALLLLGRQSWPKRLGDSILFAGSFCLLPAINALRNLSIGGSATNRTLAFHPISLDHVKEAMAVFASWASPLGVDAPRQSANAQPVVAAIGLLLFGAIVAAGCVIAWRRRSQVATLAGVATLYAACFVALLAFSISFVDFHTPADQRVLSPVYAAWVIVAACAASAGIGALATPARVIAVMVCALFVLICAWPALRPPIGRDTTGGTVWRLYREGDGFAHAIWQRSPTLAAVRELPAELQIFTNAPGAVYLLTGRQFILTIPAEVSASSRLPNPEYPDLMARIRAETDAGRGVVVWLKRYGARRPLYPTEAQVMQKLHLEPMVRFSDGAIHVSRSPTTRAAQKDP